MALSLPASPTTGQTFTSSGRTWSWTGAAWELVPATALVSSVAGRTGAVTLTAADVGLGNVSNVDATARANHTGSQAITTVTGLQAALDAKQPTISSYVSSVAGRTGAVTLTAADVSGVVPSTTTGITGAAAITNMVSLTQAQYDALGSKSSTTLYIISG
jgi:hypothetical protein